MRRAGELTAEEVERLVTIVQNPRQFKVPDWMLNRKKDNKDGKYSQAVSNILDMKYREDLERMKKIRAHRGLRHYCACHARPPLLLPRRTRIRPLCASPCRRCARRMPAADRRRRVRRSQGVCACVASAQRPRAARAAPSVSPRKRARRAPPLLTTRARRGRVAPRGRALSSSHTRFYCYALLSAQRHLACCVLCL